MQGFPIARAGMTIGLLGGSFDPAHAGHVHLTRQALNRLRLDQVWWLVSPGNPLKLRGPAPMAQRVARAQAMMRHPRVQITDLEARLGTRYTAQTLVRLLPLYPGVRFVWLMGADNLASFHRWDRWESIARLLPMAVIARPGAGLSALRSPAARRFRTARLPSVAAARLARMPAPAWVYLNVPLMRISSTELRARGGWPSGSGSGTIPHPQPSGPSAPAR
ncbi:nicotinate-nucleotide adenylyltransferase [Plastorhodobacter daqingensis]|uniref:Probable nicotinate-nucleotide adenylyltransferase n=1 Tax=Plastorhodobacter daqingensis TaxID=1387281 RepID=A0ABW2UI69_9RHOB